MGCAWEFVTPRPVRSTGSTRTGCSQPSTGTGFPRHIGVIHDGHRRYARSERLPDYQASYRVGMTKFVEFLHWSDDLEIPAVTCWLLSKENLARPDEELLPYYEVLQELFDEIPNALERSQRRRSLHRKP